MRKLYAVILAAVLTLAAVLFASLPAQATSADRRATSRGTTAPIPVLNRGEAAQFRVVDTGRQFVITGTAIGMDPATNYVSLIYPDDRCATGVAGSTGMTLNDTWQDRGDRRQHIRAVYNGAAYRAVKAGGGIGSVSIRAVTSVVVAPVATATLEARACADITPNRR